MNSQYFDLINQTFDFPQEGFDLNEQGWLYFNQVPIKHLIQKYGTPLRISYVPRIGIQIKKAKNLFARAIRSTNYAGKYHYCYCTKSNYFNFIIEEALKFGVNLETSSAFDTNIILNLHQQGKLDKSKLLIHNGFKPKNYIQGIANLMKEGFNSLPICDNIAELDHLNEAIDGSFNIGIRVATEEEPNFEFYTSRLGIRNKDVLDFYTQKIEKMENVTLKMLHFFVDTGIKDTLYYWGEFKKAVKLYAQLKKVCPTLTGLNIGGGLPIRNSLGFDYDYKYMIGQIVNMIKEACDEEGVAEPDIYTEFGKYTVGESGAIIYSVLAEKKQNDRELWYMLDNSLMTTIPDAWGIAERFILLPINKWYNDYTKVNLGGLTCDNSDYYNSEIHENSVYLPSIGDKNEPLYIGFFHTGAYQDALSGYGGIKHCLIPSPKHIVISRDEAGNLVDKLHHEEQKADAMLKLLGY